MQRLFVSGAESLRAKSGAIQLHLNAEGRYFLFMGIEKIKGGAISGVIKECFVRFSL